MIWFKYLKEAEILSESTVNTNYSYPIARRRLTSVSPFFDIQKDDVLYCNVDGLNIGSKYDSSLSDAIDYNSILVVYEDLAGNYTPVKCGLLNPSTLAFLALKEHKAFEDFDGSYNLYYRTPNLRFVSPVDNGGVDDFQVDSDSLDPVFDIGFILTIYPTQEVNVSDSGYYSFNFMNPNYDWNNGESKTANSKMYLTFRGPNFTIFGDKGPNRGIFNYKIYLANSESKYKKIIQEGQIDCYFDNVDRNEILLNLVDLPEEDFILEVDVTGNKNSKSSDYSIKFNRYFFDKVFYFPIEEEELFFQDGAITR